MWCSITKHLSPFLIKSEVINKPLLASSLFGCKVTKNYRAREINCIKKYIAEAKKRVKRSPFRLIIYKFALSNTFLKTYGRFEPSIMPF